MKCCHGNHDSRGKEKFEELVNIFDFSNTIACLTKSDVPYGELCVAIF